jgi:hypothetical protein
MNPLECQRKRTQPEVLPKISQRLCELQRAEGGRYLEAVAPPGKRGGVAEERIVVDQGARGLEEIVAFRHLVQPELLLPGWG